MASSNQWMLLLKVVLISAVVVFVAVTMKLAVPLMLNFAVCDLPAIWSIVVSWLKPPYIYLLINGIIITIAASTRFHQNLNQSQQQLNPPNTLPPSDLTSELPLGVMETSPVVYDNQPIVMVEPPVVYETKRAVMDVKTGPDAVGRNEDDFITRSTWHPSHSAIESPLPPKFNFPVREKQLITSRFAHNRKTTPEGARALRVLKPKKHETMESTWKMITDGRHMPLTRHLRKSDTFDNVQHPTEFTKVTKKSETFKDRTNYENENQYLQPSSTNSSPAAGGNLKKDGSLSQDELNRRVEAFIKKFNDDMRLQRQESLNQYREMVKRRAH